jgi:hypothetical protein
MNGTSAPHARARSAISWSSVGDEDPIDQPGLQTGLDRVRDKRPTSEQPRVLPEHALAAAARRNDRADHTW